MAAAMLSLRRLSVASRQSAGLLGRARTARLIRRADTQRALSARAEEEGFLQPSGPQGLYDPAFEHDNCGVGLVASIEGVPCREIMDDGRTILARIEHRGAVGEEANTGDGAGVMTSIPHRFLKSRADQYDLYGDRLSPADFPEEGRYVVGNVFLNPDRGVRRQTKMRFEKIASDLGLRVLGWRRMTTDNADLGPSSLALEPNVQQVLVVPEADHLAPTTAKLEQLAFQLTQRSRNAIRGTGARTQTGPTEIQEGTRKLMRTESADAMQSIRGVDNFFFLCSLSGSTLTYKGQFTCTQLFEYYEDLRDPLYESSFAMVHSRFSTNTFPSWDRAQPLRFLCHNGEINTVRGNRNWMRAREGIMESPLLSREALEEVYPIVDEAGSDSSCLDDVLHFMLKSTDRSLPEAMMMLVPEAWENQSAATLSLEKRKFYEWASFIMEPWDGPALFCFSDGRHLGAKLDRNGLRPCRYTITNDNRLVMASETGVLHVEDSKVAYKGKLEPGKMLLLDLEQGRMVPDEEIKKEVVTKNDYDRWTSKAIVMQDIIANKPPMTQGVPTSQEMAGQIGVPLAQDLRLPTFGYTVEHVDLLLAPMIKGGKEAMGSMGNDTPLACLSPSPRLLFDFFKQHFAQVTNPPIDPFRERSVMTLRTCIGPCGNLLATTQDQCRRLVLDRPLLTTEDLDAIVASPPAREDRVPGAKARAARDDAELRRVSRDLHRSKGRTRHSKANPDKMSARAWRGRSHCIGPTVVLPTTFPKYPRNVGQGIGLERELRHLLMRVDDVIDQGAAYIVLSDRTVDHDHVPIPSLLALGAVHQHLVRNRRRLDVGLIVDSGEVREVHHFASLLGFGADAVCPYLAIDILHKMVSEGIVEEHGLTRAMATDRYFDAIDLGLRKIMAKFGVSSMQGYKGAQIFEAVGIDKAVAATCFTGTPSRIGGINYESIGKSAILRHEYGFPSRESLERTLEPTSLQNPGDYHFRDGGETHINNPQAIAALQASVKMERGGYAATEAYRHFSDQQRQAVQACTIRGMLEIIGEADSAIDISDVEPAEAIVKRFATGAMSFGSISSEAHTTLAKAMNRLGAKSNTGEGGEDYARFTEVLPNGDRTRSSIKQVASGRFGVSIEYLSNADEIQIKMAQGAKPGEGGELPGFKVDQTIAATRMSTPGVGLISPPPHHDIYSIEDLAQLILDLKSANPQARISVKLVSEAGVGTIAAGVAKAHSEHILVSGHDGGTGAAAWTGVKHAGLPWELGLAETHQTLVLNNLRGRVVVQTDGQLRTGRDVVVAALLGAEEFGFATAPLIAMGCIMMRKCHLNTCPVGIATQDPELRRRFTGEPEHVVNYFFAVAEEVRGYMATLGFRTLDEMVGHSEFLRTSAYAQNLGLDFSGLTTPAESLRPGVANTYDPAQAQDHALEQRQEHALAKELRDHMDGGANGVFTRDVEIQNFDRSFGATVSHELVRAQQGGMTPPDLVHLRLKGQAGQSFGAFCADGLFLELEGDANDYVGKGLSGGEIAIFPSPNYDSSFAPEHSAIAGNACLYGATAGKAFLSGQAAQRFGVRNSGATAVVEGVGDHGAEYMTGGCLVVLGETGSNFAAGMSGGLAFVYDDSHAFRDGLCNMEMVDLVPLEADDLELVHGLIGEHQTKTGSPLAGRMLADWENHAGNFIKVYPRDYRKALESGLASSMAQAQRSPVAAARVGAMQSAAFSTTTGPKADA